jgi:hypothetical protein
MGSWSIVLQLEPDGAVGSVFGLVGEEGVEDEGGVVLDLAGETVLWKGGGCGGGRVYGGLVCWRLGVGG